MERKEDTSSRIARRKYEEKNKEELVYDIMLKDYSINSSLLNETFHFL